MRKFAIIVYVVLSLLSVKGYAQKVYLSGNMVVLEATEEAGMPPGTSDKISKTAIYDLATLSNGSSITGNSTTETINATVYEKLEIATSTQSQLAWTKAFEYCRDLELNGKTDWRLPTQREIMLIAIFKDALNMLFTEISATTITDKAIYWSATENNASLAWAFYFTTGTIQDKAKVNTYILGRCVREID